MVLRAASPKLPKLVSLTTALRYPIALFCFRSAYQDFVVGAHTTSAELLVIEALRRWADLHQLPMLLTLHNPFFPHPRGAEHPRVGRKRPRATPVTPGKRSASAGQRRSPAGAKPGHRPRRTAAPSMEAGNWAATAGCNTKMARRGWRYGADGDFQREQN
jgi:hypothetical protein